jgi:pyridoxal kinase
MENKKQILLVNDLAGYGKVALSAMMPIFSHMGFEIFTLPTALVSNTLDYGRFEILDTKDYIAKTIQIWRELQFSFQSISIGFIASDEEAEILANFCSEQKKKNTFIFVDPIMGDDGHLYNGISEEAVKNRKRLLTYADLVKPNYTEACLLTGMEYKKEGVKEKEWNELLKKIQGERNTSVVITSVPVEGKKCCIGFDRENGEKFCLEYDELDVRFPGTGDIFSAILLGGILQGQSLCHATAQAMKIVKEMIEKNIENIDKYRGIPVEQYLDLI